MTEEVSDDERYEALYESIREGNRDDLKAFFQKESEACIYFLRRNNWPPSLEAAAHGQTDILWELVHEYGFNVDDSFELEPSYEEIYGSGNERKEEHSLCRGTALTVALEAGHWATAAFLITEGADVNAMFFGSSAQNNENFGYEISNEEGTCLYLALVNKAPSRIIELMHTNGLEVDAEWGDYDEKDTLLGVAIRGKKPALVAKLLELGADPNQNVCIPHEGQWHTLCFITYHYIRSDPDWLTIIRLLIEHGADNEFDPEDEDYEGVYQSALSIGDEALLSSLGLMEKVVSELKEAKRLEKTEEERSDNITNSPAELVINLWAICDIASGVVYNLLGRTYNVSGNDEDKLAFLHRLAGSDYVNAERQPLNSRFVIAHIDGSEKRGVTFLDAVHNTQSGVFEDMFEYLESNLPEQPMFTSTGLRAEPQRLPKDPLCVTTILCETDTGEIRPMITDEDKAWVADYMTKFTNL